MPRNAMGMEENRSPSQGSCEKDAHAINLLSESPLVTTPFLTGICLIFSFLLRSFLFYPPVSSGACQVWFWSSNWLLPFNPFWFPQNENWPMPCLCYPKFFHSVTSFCLFFIFQWDLTSLFPNISWKRFVKSLKPWLLLPSPGKCFPGVIYSSDPQVPQSLVWIFPITRSMLIHIHEFLIDKYMPENGLPQYRGYRPACQCRGHEFDPWSGKIPHARAQLGPFTTTTEPAPWSPHAATTEAICF